jgi:hypothetical protein
MVDHALKERNAALGAEPVDVVSLAEDRCEKGARRARGRLGAVFKPHISPLPDLFHRSPVAAHSSSRIC